MLRASLRAVGALSLVAGLACVVYVGQVRDSGNADLVSAQPVVEQSSSPLLAPDTGLPTLTNTLLATEMFPGAFDTYVGKQLDNGLPADPSAWFGFNKEEYVAPTVLSCGCFAPNTPDDVIQNWMDEIVHESMGPAAYHLLCRWSGTIGSPRDLAWSFVPDGVHIPSGVGEPAGNSALFSRMDSLFGGNRALWVSKFQESFDRWEQLAGMRYERRTAAGVDWDDGAVWGTDIGSQRGDVRIGMKTIDGQFNTLAYNPFPCDGDSPGDMVMDFAENWAAPAFNYRSLRNVVMHEHGHGLGILHVCPVNGTKLMEPLSTEVFDGPQQDDIRAVHEYYGDAFENDDTRGVATEVGSLGIGQSTTIGTVTSPAVANSSLLSIDRNGEQDYFEFELTSASHLSVTVFPVGSFYDNSTQAGNGSCNSGSFIDSRDQANLAIDIEDAEGVVITCDNVGLGGTENCQWDFLDPGVNYVRVYETGSQSEVQLYRISFTVSALGPCVGVECDDGLWCNGEEFCDDGNCFNGTPPCDPVTEVCNEGAQVCTPAPGACCLPDGSCEEQVEGICASNAGFYYGDGVSCDGPLDPPCEPVDTIISCTPSAAVAFADTSVDLTTFIENVSDLSQYQVGIEIIPLSGTGSATVDCSACTGGANDKGCGVRIDETRPDWVMFDESAIAAASCGIPAGGGVMIFGSVDVAKGEMDYLADFTIDISSDATPGSEFEIRISNDPSLTAITNSDNEFLGFQGQSCVITIVDPSDCLPPEVSSNGSRTFDIVPQGIAPQALLVTGDPGDGDVSCVSAYVQADGTLGPAPVLQTPAEWGSLVNPRGLEIIPSETYNVQAECGKSLSIPVEVTTWLFADLDNNGVANLADTQLAVQAFQNDYSNVTPGAADVDPCAPNGVNNLADAFLTVLGFQGQTYADVCTPPCP